MGIHTVLSARRPLVVGAAAIAPLLLCAALATFRDSVPNATAALALVVLVVAAASTGIRAAGLIAAASSALWFDVLLTEPIGKLAIDDAADIEATVLLIVVGITVTELALWGLREQARASRTTGYLAGLVDTASTAARSTADPASLVRTVSTQITNVLGIDSCRYVPGSPGYHDGPILTSEGTVVSGSRALNVTREGLPVDNEIFLLVRNAGAVVGHFLLTASTHVARPNVDQLRTAVLLADQLGSVMTSEPRTNLPPS